MNSYIIRYIDSSMYSKGKTLLNIEKFCENINKQKDDLVMICNNTIINRRAIAYIEIEILDEN